MIFRHFVKNDFELHLCCHEFDLSDITNWQHIGGGPPGRNFCRNFCLPLAPALNFHLWRLFFSHFDKINNFRQQKQLLLFLSNRTPKVCCWKFPGLGTPSGPQEVFKLKKTPFLGVPRLKMAPHRRFGGSKIPVTLIFSISNKKCQLFVKEIFSSLCCSKSYRLAQKN